MESPPLLPRVTPESMGARPRGAFDERVGATARAIVDDVAARGRDAALEHAERLGDWRPGEPIVHEPAALRAALDSLDPATRRVLSQAAERISTFAAAQRAALHDIDVPVPAGAPGIGSSRSHPRAVMHPAGDIRFLPPC